jgi:spermidine synthase
MYNDRKITIIILTLMNKYDGLLVYQAYDDNGLLEIVEADGIRSLHFGTSPRQSSMSLDDKDRLELDYVRAMTCFQLFKKDVSDDVLMLGLGGGSLTKFLLHSQTECHIKVIEFRKAVVKIARSHFELPSDPRLKVIIDDGGYYVCQRVQSHKASYGLMFIDAFDHDSMASSVCDEAFFFAAKQLLKRDAMLIINLWGGFENPLFIRCKDWLNLVFKNRVLFLPVRNKSNIIGFAFNEFCSVNSTVRLRLNAQALEQHYHIEYQSFLSNLRKYNAETFNTMFNK